MKNAHRIVPVEKRVIASLCKSFGSERDVSDDKSIFSFAFDYTLHKDLSAFRKDYSVYSLLRKWQGLKVDTDREANAFQSWKEAEERCFHTNRKLVHETTTGCYSVAPRIISDAQRKIARILGPVQMDSISSLCRFGNGATFDKRRGTSHAEKYVSPTVTINAVPYACITLSGDTYVGQLVGGFRDLKIVRANRMVMVPKTSKTDRPISAEPTLNSFIQQGIGRYIRSRLMKFGVDLDDQTINKDLARRAYFDGLATIDLTSASDTLCIGLVKLLLPEPWFELLDATRSHFTQYKGKTYLNSKFSSMGNAFTFELESLIFYALTSASCDANVTSVYGDDIIIKDSDYPSVVKTLEWAGFVINKDKSYRTGSDFFESCGGQYFRGEDVTPPFQKDVCRYPHEFIALHNRLVRAGIRLNLRDEFNEAARVVRDCYVSAFGKKRVPDLGPVVEYDEYFIQEDFVWPSDLSDRVKLVSVITRPNVKLKHEDAVHIAYVGRKLRTPDFLNPDPHGQCSESSSHVLRVIKPKNHWRSACALSPNH